MNKLPHRLIGIILSEDEFGKVGIGTGILISPDLVLTVAHNIYDGKKESSKIRFCRGHSGPIGDY
jgi:V8-like Glu-specific endopeptidase